MEKLVSNWCRVRPVPEDYVFPPETRPGIVHVPISESFPVIDLNEAEKGDPTLIMQKILKAAQEFGFFQVINHGIPENLMNETISVLKEFFQMPAETKQHLWSEGFSMKDCRLITSSVTYATEKVHLWRDCLKHPCHPLEKWQHIWPQIPARYQECIGVCSVEIKKLASRILKFISEGLGLDGEYLEGEYSQSMILSANHYPPCPQPDLTLGLSKHADPYIITLLLQDDVYGLQVLKDDTWLGVRPNPHAIVVNIGSQLQVISNNKLKSAEHRAVTNSGEARTSVVFFIGALEESIIEPAKELVDELHPPIYKPFKNKDFLYKFYASNGDSQGTLENFKA
ncbi:protein DOWNY MILDEW RESISTANCE 6-like isoform X2 [Prosopis cineraria]|uniref:protein DOWNY MILDEW RESISTANCE 6-like isoform X2 n=1 Tax=Prosopis cineraria TaxID=364024 RepID=UPI00241024FC|nr:protein DOWNY MILDEW RESISTANCE 6-like isoform X2 [Prosopis cineraria]XP_054819381.1 protein DOWNY MILDEW RESISTANCE 6-like isoform X2 [Prosopis cineraria]